MSVVKGKELHDLAERVRKALRPPSTQEEAARRRIRQFELAAIYRQEASSNPWKCGIYYFPGKR